MNIDEIIKTHDILQKELRMALSTMEQKDTVYQIREKIKINQSRCPHFSVDYNYVWVDDRCPYCGKFMKKGEYK